MVDKVPQSIYLHSAHPTPPVARANNASNIPALPQGVAKSFADFKRMLPHFPSVTELFHKPRLPGRGNG